MMNKNERPADAAVPECPSWANCRKCVKCRARFERGRAVAAPHAELIRQQSVKVCRVCDRPEQYCGGAGAFYFKHDFQPRMTCESCVHMGRRYWGSDDRPIHFCGKEKERRAANFRSCGNFGDDFLNEFRKFYDAGPWKSAESCKFFEPRTEQVPA